MTINTLARALSLGLMVFLMVPANAEARKSKAKPSNDARVIALLERVISDNVKLKRELVEIKQRLRPDAVVASADPAPPLPPRNPVLRVAPMPIPDADKTLKAYESHIARSAKLKDLTPKLADKVAHILAACSGARLVSGYRRGARVAGSGRPSLHSHYPSKAADLAGNPDCIRRQMADWPGGLSTDYSAVRHYHVSYAPHSREWGARFAHYRGGFSHHGRYARHHRRYAQVR